MKHDDLWPVLLSDATPTRADITWILIALLVLMAVAVVAEQFRQRRLRRRRVAVEWQTVEQIAREKQLSDSEWKRFKGCIARWHSSEPLRAATVRLDFDRCVESEMKALLEKGDPEQYARAGAELRDIRVHLNLDYIPYGQRIHSTRELSTGQLVTLWPANEKGQPTRRQMRVLSLDEAYLHLAPAGIGGGGGPEPSPGEAFRCQVWRDDDARYMFTIPFVRAEADPPQWALQHTSDLDRMQSRNFFRIRYEQTVSVGVMDPPAGGDTERLARQPVTARLRGRVTSLSAGGYALVVQQPVPAHVFLRLRLDLPGSGTLELDSRIVGTSLLGGGRTLVRASFVNVDDETRDELVKFVTLQQQQPASGSPESPD